MAVGARRSSAARPVGVMGLVVLLILASIVVLAIVGCDEPGDPERAAHRLDPRRASGDRSARWVGPERSFRPATYARGVSRSPDGRLVAFWTTGRDRSHLYVIGVDGQHRRELAPDLSLGWLNAIDVWSSDSRFLATGRPSTAALAGSSSPMSKRDRREW